MAASEAADQLTYLMRPLAEWLDDHATEELCINRPGEVFVRQKGWFRRETIALTLADLEDIADLGRGAAQAGCWPAQSALRHRTAGRRTPANLLAAGRPRTERRA